MYETGTQFNFEDRLHQLCSTTGDLALYRTESGDYTFTVNELRKIEKEVEKKTNIS